MGIVCVNDVGVQLFDDAPQPPRGRQIQFVAWRKADQIVPFRHAPEQRSFRMRYQRGTMTKRTKALNGQQDLVLAPTPRARRIDVEGEHES